MVKVYRNLHKPGKLSVQVKNGKSWKVQAHVEEIYLRDVTFVVQPSGRARVLREKKKHVHAFVKGLPCKNCPDLPRTATYNPYKYTSFVDVETGQPVLSASFAFVEGSGGIKYLL